MEPALVQCHTLKRRMDWPIRSNHGNGHWIGHENGGLAPCKMIFRAAGSHHVKVPVPFRRKRAREQKRITGTVPSAAHSRTVGGIRNRLFASQSPFVDVHFIFPSRRRFDASQYFAPASRCPSDANDRAPRLKANLGQAPRMIDRSRDSSRAKNYYSALRPSSNCFQPVR